MYLKKNVNFLLLLLVVMVLVGTVGITTYFQSTYKEVSQDLENKSQQLQVVSSNFSQKINELNRTSSELQLNKIDKDKLEQLYSDLLKEKEKLDGELEVANSHLAEAMDSLKQAQAKLSDANYKLLLQESELTELNTKLQNLDNTIRDQRAQIDNLKKQLCDEKTAQGKPC